MLDERFQEPAAATHVARPRVLLWQARAAYVGPSLRLSPHRNAVATIAIGFERPFAFTLLDGDATSQRVRMALIPPDTLHHIDGHGLMAFVYLDSLSDDWNSQRICSNAVPRSTPCTDLSANALADWLSTTVGLEQRATKPSALTDVIRAIDEHPNRFASVDDAARLAGLSSSRFQHVFREIVGVPFRRYRLWRRMGVVARALGRGVNLTDAALEAGFSSSAHLSATFRTMFGIAPSTLVAARARIESI